MKHRGNTNPTPLVVVLGLIAMAATWIVLVSTTQLHEMIVGSVSVLASGVFLWHVHRAESLQLRFEASDIFTIWRLPWEVVSDVWVVCLVLAKDLAGHPADSLYRVSGFVTAKDDPTLAAKRVLATVYTTASPNMIVIGVDYHQSRMLFHQIKRADIPKTTQALGARP